jgi:hypothetical protein
VAIGQAFVREAAVAATSARRHLRDPITLFTDHAEEALRFGCFDHVTAIERSGRRPHRDKLVAMLNTPYEQTLLLDTDVYVASSLDDNWELLEHYDMAAAVDRGYVDVFPPGHGVPDPYKEFNTGVLYFRRSSELDRVLLRALELFDRLEDQPVEGGKVFDQTALRLALYGADLRLVPLPDEDNCRFATYGKLNGPVRVLHGRLPRAQHTPDSLERVLRRLNSTTVPRVFVAGRAWALVPRRFGLLGQYRAERLKFYFRIEISPILGSTRRGARRAIGRGARRTFRALRSVRLHPLISGGTR